MLQNCSTSSRLQLGSLLSGLAVESLALLLRLVLEALEKHDPAKPYWVTPAADGVSYECYGRKGLLGTFEYQWFTSSPSYRVKCLAEGHGAKCAKLIGIKHRTTEEMIDLLGSWLALGQDCSPARHFATRPT